MRTLAFEGIGPLLINDRKTTLRPSKHNGGRNRVERLLFGSLVGGGAGLLLRLVTKGTLPTAIIVGFVLGGFYIAMSWCVEKPQGSHGICLPRDFVADFTLHAIGRGLMIGLLSVFVLLPLLLPYEIIGGISRGPFFEDLIPRQLVGGWVGAILGIIFALMWRGSPSQTRPPA